MSGESKSKNSDLNQVADDLLDDTGLEFNIPLDDEGDDESLLEDGDVSTGEIMTRDSSEVLTDLVASSDGSESDDPESDTDDEGLLDGLDFGVVSDSEGEPEDEASFEADAEGSESLPSGGLEVSFDEGDDTAASGQIELDSLEVSEDLSESGPGGLDLSSDDGDEGFEFSDGSSELDSTNNEEQQEDDSATLVGKGLDFNLSDDSDDYEIENNSTKVHTVASESSSDEVERPDEEMALKGVAPDPEVEEVTGEFDMGDILQADKAVGPSGDEDEDEATRATIVANYTDTDITSKTMVEGGPSFQEMTPFDANVPEDSDQDEDDQKTLIQTDLSNAEDMSYSFNAEEDVESILEAGDESLQSNETDNQTRATQISNFSKVSTDQNSEGRVEITPQEQRVVDSYNQDEMVRLQSTIRQLREEREAVLEQINEFKDAQSIVAQENLGLKAELEELKIEVNILRKRHADEIDEMQYRLRVNEEKKAVYEEKSKHLQRELERLGQKVRIDFNKVKQREKELEGQLELVSMDAESQVRSRDQKILELKRKIDQLEFNMENAHIREQKYREDKYKLEERLTKIMKTLRGSIKVLENDLDFDEELLEKIKKM